jgi:hypothetical protein
MIVPDFTNELRRRVRELVKQKQDALGRLADVIERSGSSGAEIVEAQQDVEKLTAKYGRLMAEMRADQMEHTQTAVSSRSRVGQRPFRELVLDLLDEIGVPSSPRVVSEYALSRLGLDLPIARFASLRRDEERAYRKDALSRPAWVVPAINIAGLVPIPRLVAVSVWPSFVRLIGPRTLRVNHLKTMLTFVKRTSEGESDSETGRRMSSLVFRFARGVPGTWSASGEMDQIKEAAEKELSLIEPADEAERRAAADRLDQLSRDQQLWGRFPVIRTDADADYRVSG